MKLAVGFISLVIAQAAVSAFAQNKNFDEEATATIVLLNLSSQCAESIPDSNWSYAERVAKHAWGKEWKLKSARIMASTAHNFSNQTIAKQHETCLAVAKALKRLK